MPKSQVQIRYKDKHQNRSNFISRQVILNIVFRLFLILLIYIKNIYFFLVGHIWCCICYDVIIFTRIWRRYDPNNPEIFSFRKVNIRLWIKKIKKQINNE